MEFLSRMVGQEGCPQPALGLKSAIQTMAYEQGGLSLLGRVRAPGCLEAAPVGRVA